MKRFPSLLLERRIAAAIAVGACMSVSLLAWLGYVAVREWQHSVVLLAARQADDASDLLLSGLTRDMRAVQRLVLTSPALDTFALRPPYEAFNLVASAFARYQYPESFFLWRSDGATASGLFLNRRERPPAWARPVVAPNRFPLTVDNQAPVAGKFLDRIRSDASRARRFSVFEITVDGVPYQVVARLFYRDAFQQELDVVLGFTVNLQWVREHYFPAVLRETAWTRAREDVLLTVIDASGHSAASTGSFALQNALPSQRRAFPLMFFDPLLIAADPPPDLRRQSWVVQAQTRDDSSLAAAIQTADRILMLLAVAAGTLAFGLMLTLRASRSRIKLAHLQSEFVSSVTHEFKTPIATIQAAGETMSSGRVDTPAAYQEYAGYIVQEARRLTRLVDNLLTFSRLTESGVVPQEFEPVALAEVVAGTLGRFALQIAERKVEVQVDVPENLPLIAGDPNAIGLMFDNLLDNAIRHSRTAHQLRISAAAGDDRLVLQVADTGGGIAADELRHVTRKFYRGRHAGQGGTGLGLAIASRIVAEHAGTLSIHSEEGVGTTVTLNFPLAPPDVMRSPSVAAPTA